MRILWPTALMLVACQPVPEASKSAHNPIEAPDPPRRAVESPGAAVPVVTWAWVEDERGSAIQVSPAYGTWGSETIEFECSNHVFENAASVDCSRYRGESLWRFDRKGPGTSGDALIEGSSVYTAWADEARTTVQAFELEGGAALWSATIDAGGVVQLDVDSDTLLLHDEHGTSYALERSTGEVLGSAQLPADLLAVTWTEGPTEVVDTQGRTWSVHDGRLVGDSVVVELPQRPYRTEERREVRWSVEVLPSGLAVHERVDVPRFAMRWTHFYDFDGHELGHRRIVAGSEHPGLWELHVVPERTLPPQ